MLIGDLMQQSGVTFGTSGARGRVRDMTDAVCYAYTQGFLALLAARGALPAGAPVGLAGDLRPSTGRVLGACARAVLDAGARVVHCGRIPTPALAAFGLGAGMPTLMVTGSHIPDDRNGIKFYLPTGEILKEDEVAMRAQPVRWPAGLFAADGAFVDAAVGAAALPPVDPAAFDAYVARYRDYFPPDWLAGLRVGVYEHSSVAREALVAVLAGLGAEVTRLGWAADFIPVDTEAIRPEDVALARDWAAGGRFDALVSADGDGDRPLVADAAGTWLRGDILGILCAKALGAAAVVTPVSSNTALERSGWFPLVRRTRIGSPYVIAAMQGLTAQGIRPVVGYEANGGFLLDTDLSREGRVLKALPTRDAVIVAVAVLGAAHARRLPLARVALDLPPRFTASDRLKDFPTELAATRLAAFRTGDPAADLAAVSAVFADACAPVAAVDHTDGVRITLVDGDILHLRPSGNAPELRIYTEAATAAASAALNARVRALLEGWRRDGCQQHGGSASRAQANEENHSGTRR